jgi:hypothetical protein
MGQQQGTLQGLECVRSSSNQDHKAWYGCPSWTIRNVKNVIITLLSRGPEEDHSLWLSSSLKRVCYLPVLA